MLPAMMRSMDRLHSASQTFRSVRVHHVHTFVEDFGLQKLPNNLRNYKRKDK